jgi:hypothetical protein
MRAAFDYHLIFYAVSAFLSKSLGEARRRQVEYVEDTVTKRLNNDFLHRGPFSLCIRGPDYLPKCLSEAALYACLPRRSI